MTRSNRLLNRILLAVVGLLAIAAGGVLAAPRLLPLFGLEYPRLTTEGKLPIVVAVCAVAIIVALTWAVSRGRGRIREAIVDGTLSVDTSVAEALLARSLADEPDILRVRVTAYRRRSTVLYVRLTTRRSPDLERVRASLSDAIASLDSTLGATVPIAVQISSGTRTAFAPALTAR